MVVTTGNKSEMAVGYATLYGDMCGGYNVLKDVYKTTAFELCRWRNAHLPAGAMGRAGRVIPERIIDKPPSAELEARPEGRDSLPPYPVLDAILKRPDRTRSVGRGTRGRRLRCRDRHARLAAAREAPSTSGVRPARCEDHLPADQPGTPLPDRQRLQGLSHAHRAAFRSARQEPRASSSTIASTRRATSSAPWRTSCGSIHCPIW